MRLISRPSSYLATPTCGINAGRTSSVPSLYAGHARGMIGLARRKGHDGNFTASPIRFLIACVDSGTARHRVASGVLGTRNQRCDVQGPGGVSPPIWPL